jgi:hypothetical protein
MYSRPATRQAIKNPTNVNRNNSTRLLFGEASVSADVVPQISSIEQVHHQVQILSILEGIVHVHDEGVVQLRQNLPFIHDRLYTSLRYNSGFGHLLHGVLLLGLLAFNLPNLAEATLADAVQVCEVALGEG